MDKVETEELVTLDSDALAVATNDLRIAMMAAGRSPIETPWEAIAKAVIRSYVEALSRDTESGWRDIVTAPKDGGYFLAAWVRDDGSDPVYGVVWWDNGDWHEYDSSIVVSDPTHWKQITPPEAKTP